MAISKQPYKGSRDFFPPQMRVRDYLFNKMKEVAHSFAYEAYDGPLLEEVELYKAKSGEELINDQIYSFHDRGERFVAIRPEMTPTLARMVASIHKQTAKPLRWYAIPNLMRYEKPQRGRVREHWQFNVDIFGAPSVLGEVEVLNLAISFLKSFGATSKMFALQVNDREVVDAVFNKLLKLDNDSSHKLYKIIDKSKKVTPEALNEMIDKVLNETQKEIFINYLKLKNHQELKEFLALHNLLASGDNFFKIINKCNDLNLAEFVHYDPTIVRGLDYYTGLVFEIFDLNPENKRAIAGGGAYANLLQIFNEDPLPGIGFGLGDVTLKDFLETHKLLPDLSAPANDLFIVYTDDKEETQALNLANSLRQVSLKVEVNLGKMKFNKIFKTAETKGHHFVAIIEEKDGSTKAQIKNLQERTAEFFELNDIESIKKFITQ